MADEIDKIDPIEDISESSSEEYDEETIVGGGFTEDHTNNTSTQDASNHDSDIEEDPESDFEEEGISLGYSEERSMRQKKQRHNALFAAYIASQKQELKVQLASATNRDEVDEDLMSAKLMISSTDVIINDPREYQLELFETAKQQNTIAVLDTGSGKTLIACLLLRHTVDQELQARSMGQQRRVSFFLVDNVTLVFQQASVLETNLDAVIGKYCGAMGVDMWTKQHWDAILEKEHVIVMTADILHNCLTHGLIKMKDINLICFDEAHHAKKNHVYARIIRDFYTDEPEDARPRIFGMTASPVDSRDDPKEAALELERLLHSRIATASDLKLLQSSVARPNEQILEYPRLGPPFRTELYNKLYEKYNHIKSLKRIFNFSIDSTSQLGSWCADVVWKIALSETEAIKIESRNERLLNRAHDQEAIQKIEKEILMIREARDIVANHEFTEPELTHPQVSQKVLKLHQFLDAIYSKETDEKCIIFVTQRYTAYAVAELLKPTTPPYMRLGVLIGTRSGATGEENVTFRQQMVTVSRFRKGRLNCLIATSVAEEGLDIPDCNRIVRFDLYSTMIQYIQSRGRARHSSSKYVQMVESRNREHIARIIEVRAAESTMRAFCQKLPEDRLLKPAGFSAQEYLPGVYYIEPLTGAKLTPSAALQLLWRFSNTLPQESEFAIPPTYYMKISSEGQFICEIVLPPGSPVRSVEGKPYSTKAQAKQSAAFEACLQLREKGLLNEYLLPLSHSRVIPKGANSLLSLDNAKANSYPIRQKPSFWDVSGKPLPEQLYITIFGLVTPEDMGRPYQPLCVVTRERLPEIPRFRVYADRGGESDVYAVTLKSTLPLTPQTLDWLNSFTFRFFYDVFSKVFEIAIDIPYWILPIRNTSIQESSKLEDVLDTDLIELVMQKPELHWDETTPPEFFENRFLLHKKSRSRRFFTHKAVPDLTPQSLIPIGACTAPKSATIFDYSYFERQKGLDYPRENVSLKQHVLFATRVLHRINYLDKPPEREKQTPLKAYIIPSAFEVSCLPPSFASFSIVFPAISTRLDAYLHAQDVCNLMGVNLALDTALEAITKDSDNSHDDSAQKIGVKKGMGSNYERLEFLGDTFLKLATTLSLFVDYDDDDEYQLHVKRMLMVCNQNLFTNAKALKLPEYIQTQGFSRREWYPRIKLLKGKKKSKKQKAVENATAADAMAPKEPVDDAAAGALPINGPAEQAATTNMHKLAPKTIADVCEALIGAAVHNKGFDEAIKVINTVVNNSDHDKERFRCWRSYRENYKIPSYQTATATASHTRLVEQIEAKIGYRFKYPRLLASAFIHPSIPLTWENIPSYQRLEFLGDALHDQACIQYIFDKYPDKNPQWLTEHKMAMVSNKFLATLAVKLEFHRHLRYHGAGMQNAIKNFVDEVKETEASSEGAVDYWANVAGAIPKALGDCIEAFIGAMFVDSDFDFTIVEFFFNKFIKPYFLDMTIYDTYAGNHPTTLLTTKMKEVGCEDWRILSEEITEKDSTYIFSGIMVHDSVFASGTASTVKAARVKASQDALTKLADMGLHRFLKICDCAAARERLRQLKARQREAEKLMRLGQVVGGDMRELQMELEGKASMIEVTV